ncbi:hypothetical protein AMAG_20228 [Allomyces macrogynus ATCC 38327]|uniref:Uncharacterized protein n=1 Tax=Allomyces macrogynus (strain ATCC 38327) TaxID=578462 RepID=A0A0L0T5P6_ALLM3|nr:hypothetical protein AMAG_20228 [Allomyces macrogynus ATCC 38327]|eukprot:KNE70067.1 hypothetical protein AMAG_20228 [Allomyces macrogynus ATCC 38327]
MHSRRAGAHVPTGSEVTVMVPFVGDTPYVPESFAVSANDDASTPKNAIIVMNTSQKPIQVCLAPFRGNDDASEWCMIENLMGASLATSAGASLISNAGVVWLWSRLRTLTCMPIGTQAPTVGT